MISMIYLRGNRADRSGKIIALKGMGGYHLICDPLNNDAVGLLRKRKQGMPTFCCNVQRYAAATEYCFIDKIEEEELVSWR